MNCLGIDLGTSLSSVAIMENGIPVALNVETASSQLIGNDRAVPSSVFIEEDGNIILGQKADNLRLKNPSRYRKEFKRDLGTTDPYHIGNHEFLPEDLYREFFKYFKKKAEERLSAQVDKAVITHPANFAGYKKEMIKKAAEMAGITQVELIDEPTAAAIYYSTKEKIEDGEKLLVYDLGGGTFDVSLIVKEGDSFRALTPPLGIERCGGVDFQRKVYEDIIDRFSNELMPILSKRDRLSKQLSSMIEAESIKLKHNLSFSDKAETAIMIPGTFDFSNYEIQRSKFEEMIKEYIDATCRKIEDIVKNANIKMSDIDRVLLVGGSSRIPYVEETVKKTTGKPVCKDIDTELVVCYGAAILGKNEMKHNKNEIESIKPRETKDYTDYTDEMKISENVISDSHSDLKELLMPVCKNGKCGYIDCKGSLIIEAGYEDGGKFSESRAKVKLDGKWGFIDTTGKLVVRPLYDEVMSFSESLAPVKLNNKWGYVDTTDNLVIMPQYENAREFSEGLGATKLNSKWGYVNKTGKIEIKHIYECAYPFTEGLADVTLSGKSLYIDRTGKDIFTNNRQLTYKMNDLRIYVGRFSEGLLKVKYKGKYGYVDRKGEIIIETKYEDAQEFSEGLAAVKINGKWAYIDKTENMIIGPSYECGGKFFEDLACVRVNGKWGYIDRKGNSVIENMYDLAHQFSEELAEVKLNNRWGVINNKGILIVPATIDYGYLDIEIYKGGFVKYFFDGEYIIRNYDGEIIWQF